MGRFFTSVASGDEVERRAPVLSFSHFCRAGTVPGEAISVLPESTKGGRVGVHPSSHSRARRGGRTDGGERIRIRIRIGPRIDRRARAREHVHVFGHTHFGWDHTIDGIRTFRRRCRTRTSGNSDRESDGGPDSLGTAFDLSTRRRVRRAALRVGAAIGRTGGSRRRCARGGRTITRKTRGDQRTRN